MDGDSQFWPDAELDMWESPGRKTLHLGESSESEGGKEPVPQPNPQPAFPEPIPD